MLCALGALVTPPPAEVSSPLVETLLQRTAENRAINEGAVRRITQQNAYLVVSGEPGMKRLVTGVNGENIFLDEPTVARMTREGRIACGIGEPCRVVEPMGAKVRGGKPIGLPVPKGLSCDAQGR